MPEFEVLGEDGKLSEGSLIRERKRNALCPWAWCPESDAVMDGLGESGLTAAQEVMSKAWEAKVFEQGRICRSLDEVRERCGEGRWVVKAFFGASGQRNRF